MRVDMDAAWFASLTPEQAGMLAKVAAAVERQRGGLDLPVIRFYDNGVDDIGKAGRRKFMVTLDLPSVHRRAQWAMIFGDDYIIEEEGLVGVMEKTREEVAEWEAKAKAKAGA